MIDVDVENERILKEFIDGDTIYELILNVMITWMNGILKIGALNTGQKRQNFCSM